MSYLSKTIGELEELCGKIENSLVRGRKPSYVEARIIDTSKETGKKAILLVAGFYPVVEKKVSIEAKIAKTMELSYDVVAELTEWPNDINNIKWLVEDE